MGEQRANLLGVGAGRAVGQVTEPGAQTGARSPACDQAGEEVRKGDRAGRAGGEPCAGIVLCGLLALADLQCPPSSRLITAAS
jgi:hypothetical protein